MRFFACAQNDAVGSHPEGSVLPCHPEGSVLPCHPEGSEATKDLFELKIMHIESRSSNLETYPTYKLN